MSCIGSPRGGDLSEFCVELSRSLKSLWKFIFLEFHGCWVCSFLFPFLEIFFTLLASSLLVLLETPSLTTVDLFVTYFIVILMFQWFHSDSYSAILHASSISQPLCLAALGTLSGIVLLLSLIHI